MTTHAVPRSTATLVLLLAACTSGGSSSPGARSGGDPSASSVGSSAGPSAPSSDSPRPSDDSTGTTLACPDGLAIDSAGILYAADVCTNRVLRYAEDEGWTVFAGTGSAGYSGDGGPAADAELEYVGGVMTDGSGSIYITECGGNVVRAVGPDGIILTVAGIGGMGAGNGGYSGDGGPATDAELACPSDGAALADGVLYVVDRDNSVLRRIDTSGVITTIAGGGTLDTTGADAPAAGERATEARFPFESPVQVVVDATGNVFLADEKAHRVWRIDASGVMNAFAGTGVAGYSGDGGPATEAQLNGPYGLAIDADGNLHVGDYENARVRRIDPSGVITTVAGNGDIGIGGDGGPATDAQLQSPYGIVVADDGTLYVADQENAIVRLVDASGTIWTLGSP
jgi:serine/threonine-protein kinase